MIRTSALAVTLLFSPLAAMAARASDLTVTVQGVDNATGSVVAALMATRRASSSRASRKSA